MIAYVRSVNIPVLHVLMILTVILVVMMLKTDMMLLIVCVEMNYLIIMKLVFYVKTIVENVLVLLILNV